MNITERKCSNPFVEMVERTWSEKLPLKEKCVFYGKKTAQETNELKNNKSIFKKRVREVLDEYYSTPKSQRKELGNFKKYIDDSADQIVKNYEEAEAERDNQENLDYETGKVIVSFPHGTSMETIEQTMKKQATDYEIIDDGEVHIAEDLPDYRKKRLEAIKEWKSDIVVEAEIPLEDTVERAEGKFEKNKHIKQASKNIFFEADGTIKTPYASATTNDGKFNETTQWNLKNVDVPRAWKRFDAKDMEYIYEVWVAVIDSGVQMNHKELKDVLMKDKSVDVTQNNKKLINCKPDTTASATGQYTEAHGTSVAGVLAGVGNNGADIINISYSAYGPNSKSKGDKFNKNNYTAVENAIKKAVAAKVCVVCSAGNDGTTEVRYPAGFPGVIGVGAIYKNGTLASYSNESSAVDIVAPGGYNGSGGAQMFVIRPGTNYSGSGYSHGTSFAAPHVAGTVAMMMSIHYGLSPAQILSRLQSRSTKTVKGRKNTSKIFKVLDTGNIVEQMELN